MIRKVIIGGGITAAAVGLVAAPAFANPISFTGLPDSFDSSHPILPGDNIQAGYVFTVPGLNTADTVGFDKAKVSLPIACSPTGGGAPVGTIVIPLGGGPYVVNNGNAAPSNDAYEGNVSAPNLCPGNTNGEMYLTSTSPASPNNTATFSADLQATLSNSISVKFHYQDTAVRTGFPHGGSFSSTQSFAPDVTQTPVPIGAIGAVAAAVPLGAGLIVMQRRSRRRNAASAEA
jgi:hypothetical protein